MNLRDLIVAPAPDEARAKLKPIPWPTNLQPHPAATVAYDGGPMPAVDVLIVTWTVAEATALADVLSPGVSLDRWVRYTHNYATLIADFDGYAPAREEKDLARFWLTTIAGRTVALVKSDSHLSQDGPKVPNITVWRQLIAETGARLVITTGTAGGVGTHTVLGDVIVTDTVRFDCQHAFKGQPWAQAKYWAAKTVELKTSVSALLDVNAADLPASAGGDGKAATLPGVVLTTDFFAFDDAEDTFGLRSYEPDAAAVEMGDAILGLVCSTMTDPPAWVIARNASDPQMAKMATVTDEANRAGQICQDYGYTTTIGSAIVCAALVADWTSA
jgi:nucleoside phosphorylase